MDVDVLLAVVPEILRCFLVYREAHCFGDGLETPYIVYCEAENE